MKRLLLVTSVCALAAYLGALVAYAYTLDGIDCQS